MEHLNEIAAAFRQASIPCAAREPLSRHTSFQIGGPAALFCEPQNKRQLARAVAVCRQAGVRYYLLGKGTNILFADEGFDGVVIHIGEVLGNIECNGLSVTAQAGAALSKVCIAAANEGLSGLEFAYGIPGCVGGAVYMNAGAYGGEIKDVLACATFTLREDDTGPIRERMADYARRRMEKQPLDMPSAGSTFKRPEGAYAGALIDQCGLRGYAIGGAQVSQKHCGFIVNTGNATCADVLCLADTVCKIVTDETGFRLEKEVRVVK